MDRLRRAPHPVGRVVLDTGGVLAWARGDEFVRDILRRALHGAVPIVVPVPVIAQLIRGGPADAPVNLVLKVVEDFGAMTPLLARQAGVLLGRMRTTDVVDALVAAEALRVLPAMLLTSDPGDLRRLLQADPAQPRVQLIAV
jgi:hypothetical protein